MNTRIKQLTTEEIIDELKFMKEQMVIYAEGDPAVEKWFAAKSIQPLEDELLSRQETLKK